ncbi:hypothetical protein GGR51DRAFT_534202 [Nemania sp. FL0031]|nr:hypothetical protein GGR51DRAFT_534202 [Nemania sp. FL0031]
MYRSSSSSWHIDDGRDSTTRSSLLTPICLFLTAICSAGAGHTRPGARPIYPPFPLLAVCPFWPYYLCLCRAVLGSY